MFWLKSILSQITHCLTYCSSEAKIQIFVRSFTGTVPILIRATASTRELNRAVAKLFKGHFAPRIRVRGREVRGEATLTLADVGIMSGTTVEVDILTLRGGGGGSDSDFRFSGDLRALLLETKSGQKQLHSLRWKTAPAFFAELLSIAKKERGFTGDDITSHDCAALFQGKSFVDGKWAEEQQALKFHPMDRPELAEFYSAKMPDVMVSYTWARFGLTKHLPQFLGEFRARVPEGGLSDEEATFWLDVVFNDQNSPNMKLYLDIAELLYSGARFHAAFLFGRMLTRAWCVAEIKARFLSALSALGLLAEGAEDRTAAVIEGGERLAAGEPAFTAFVTVRGLTDLDGDVLDRALGAAAAPSDRFARLDAWDKGDLAAIRGALLAAFGSKEAFNFYMRVVRGAVLRRHAALHPAGAPPLGRRRSVGSGFCGRTEPAVAFRGWMHRACGCLQGLDAHTLRLPSGVGCTEPAGAALCLATAFRGCTLSPCTVPSHTPSHTPLAHATLLSLTHRSPPSPPFNPRSSTPPTRAPFSAARRRRLAPPPSPSSSLSAFAHARAHPPALAHADSPLPPAPRRPNAHIHTPGPPSGCRELGGGMRPAAVVW